MGTMLNRFLFLLASVAGFVVVTAGPAAAGVGLNHAEPFLDA
jgi:hypothetical protein